MPPPCVVPLSSVGTPLPPPPLTPLTLLINHGHDYGETLEVSVVSSPSPWTQRYAVRAGSVSILSRNSFVDLIPRPTGWNLSPLICLPHKLPSLTKAKDFVFLSPLQFVWRTIYICGPDPRLTGGTPGQPIWLPP